MQRIYIYQYPRAINAVTTRLNAIYRSAPFPVYAALIERNILRLYNAYATFNSLYYGEVRKFPEGTRQATRAD